MNIIELLIKASGSSQTKTSLADVKAGLDMVTDALGMLKDVGVGAFEFAEAGAQVQQTKESFSDLGISIDQLRKSVNGTVPDMTLMSGTLTLTAGASEEMKKAYVDAVPKLLEMSKASAKLNPTLGDTAFMYSSIATAAKRQSSQIADNLGIVVKQSVAYENQAKALNKSVDALTDEEKQLAFLNELLKSGNILLDQAGGNVDSLTDSYSQLRVNLENATDGLKEQATKAEGLFKPLNSLVQKYSEWYDAANATGKSVFSLNGAIESTRLFLTGTNKTIQEYNATLNEQGRLAQSAQGALADYAATYQGQVTPQVSASAVAMDQYNMAIQQSQASSDAAAAQYQALAEAQKAAQESATSASVAEWGLASALGEVGKQQFVNMQLETLNQLREDGAIDLHTYRVATLELQKQSGLLTTAEINAMQAINRTTDSLAAGTITGGQYANQILNIQQNIDKLQDKTVRINIVTEGALPSIGVGPEDKNKVAAFAEGGTSMRTQWAKVGERGPEFVKLPAGAQVHNAHESAQMGGGVQVEAPVTIYAQVANPQDVHLLADQVSEILGRRVQSYIR